MNAKEKKLLKIFLKENIKKMLAENPGMLTEQGFWDSMSRMISGLGQQDQQLTQNVRELTQQVQGLITQNQELAQRLQRLEQAAAERSRNVDRATGAAIGGLVGGVLPIPGSRLAGAALGSRLAGGGSES
jgi:TolA-binding protein